MIELPVKLSQEPARPQDEVQARREEQQGAG